MVDNVVRFPGRRVRWRAGTTISITDRLCGAMRWEVSEQLNAEQREFFEREMHAHMMGLLACCHNGPDHQRVFEEKMLEASEAIGEYSGRRCGRIV